MLCLICLIVFNYVDKVVALVAAVLILVSSSHISFHITSNMKVFTGNITGRLVIEVMKTMFVSPNNNGPLLSMRQEC